MVAEVSVNATPTVSNSKQRRQYRLSYVSWKNRVFGRKLAYGLNWARGISSAAYAAVRKWLELGEIVNAIDTSIKSSRPVPRHIARDSMTIQDAWWDLDESMDMELHRDSRTTPIGPCCPKCNSELSIGGLGTSSDRKSMKPNEELFHIIVYCRNDDCKGGFYGEWNTSVSVPIDATIENVRSARDSNDLEGNYDEACCGFTYDQFKDFNVDDLNYCVCCGSQFVFPVRDSFDDALEHLEAACNALLSAKQSGLLHDYDYEQMNGKIAYLEEDVRNAKYRSENDSARDSKQLLKDMPRLPVMSRLEILEMARINLTFDYKEYLSGFDNDKY